jgi:plasmid replication initiation protein
MQDNPVPATPESLGVTPRFVLQYSAISRSIHDLSATAKKLTAMAMALLPPDLSSFTASFTFTSFCKALNYGDGGKEYQLFTSAVDECMKCVISLDTGKIVRGKKSWEKFTWFEYAKFNAETGLCTMIFSTKLADFLLDFKRVYAKINLSDIGRFQSKYAIRYFEMAVSYASLAGQNGNKDNAWYFERTINELREILGVKQEEYKETGNFNRYVVKKPLDEINNSGVGVKIAVENIKEGNRITSIRFDCKKAPRTPAPKRGRKKKAENPIQLELSERNSDAGCSREEKELEHLKELYPEEFAELYRAELAKIPAFIPEGAKRIGAEGSALLRLKERRGIVK